MKITGTAGPTAGNERVSHPPAPRNAIQEPTIGDVKSLAVGVTGSIGLLPRHADTMTRSDVHRGWCEVVAAAMSLRLGGAVHRGRGTAVPPASLRQGVT